MRNVGEKCCIEYQNAHHIQQVFLQKSCRLWDNTEKYCRVGQVTDDNTIRRMRIAWRIPKATNTNSEHVILTAFPRKQWFRDRAFILRYPYTSCLVRISFPHNVCTFRCHLFQIARELLKGSFPARALNLASWLRCVLSRHGRPK
jgi:hypothetical protein